MSRSFGISALLAVAFVAAARPVAATRPALPRIAGLAVGPEKVFFIQPDGSGTVLDLATGRVLERGVPERPADVSMPWCGWERRSADLPKKGTCAAPGGPLTITFDIVQSEMVLEVEHAGTVWRAVDRQFSADLKHVWVVQGKLLIESAGFSVSTLECVDPLLHKSVWLYAHPSPGLAGEQSDTESVADARATLDQFLEQARGGRPLGTVDEVGPSDPVASSEPYPGAIVLDPDPLRAAAVARHVKLAWILLLSGAGAAAVLYRLPHRPWRPWLGTAMAGGLGVLWLGVAFLQPAVMLATAATFIAVVTVGLRSAGPGTPRVALWHILLTTVACVVISRMLPLMVR